MYITQYWSKHIISRTHTLSENIQVGALRRVVLVYNHTRTVEYLGRLRNLIKSNDFEKYLMFYFSSIWDPKTVKHIFMIKFFLIQNSIFFQKNMWIFLAFVWYSEQVFVGQLGTSFVWYITRWRRTLHLYVPSETCFITCTHRCWEKLWTWTASTTSYECCVFT